MKQFKLVIYVLALLFTITAASALTITPLSNTNDTGVYRVDDTTILYRDGSDFYYYDSSGVIATATESSSCTGVELFDQLIPAEDGGKDLYTFCNTGIDRGTVYLLDYSANAFVAQTGNYSTAASEEILNAVTDRFYWFSSYASGSLNNTLYWKTNGTLRTTHVCFTGTWYPFCASASAIYKRTGRPYYPDSNATRDKIYYPVYYVFGAGRKVYNAYMTANLTGTTYGSYATSIVRPYYWYNAYSIMSEAPTKMRSEYTYYAYGDELTSTSKLGCYESLGTIYCHNGESVASGRVPNRFEVNINDGYSVTLSNSLTLPNGTTVTVRDVQRSGDNVLVVYDNLDTELYTNNALAIPKGTLNHSKSSYHEYLTVLDDFVAYCEADGDCFVATDAPTYTNPHTVEVFARIGEVITDDGLRNTTTQYDIPDDNLAVFYNSVTHEIIYNETPPYPNITGTGWGQPYIELLSTKGVYTEYPDVETVIRTYDVTNTTPYLAIECSAQSSLTDQVLASNDYSDYTDAAYGSTCTGTLRPYTTTAYDLSRALNTTSAYYVDYDENACSQNLRETLTGTLRTDETFVQEFLLGEYNGVELSFRNAYDAEVSSIMIRQDFDVAVGATMVIHANNVEVLNEADTNSRLSNHYPGYTLLVFAHFHDGDVDYEVYGGNILLWSGTVAQTSPAPIQSVRRTTMTSVYGSDHKVGFGAWVLFDGGLRPDWGDGITYLGYLGGYQYYATSCDYTDRPGVNHQLKVYTSRTGSDYDDSVSRYVQYSETYTDYVVQVETGIIPDSTAVQNQQNNIAATVSRIGLDTSSDRFLFAFIVTIVLTFCAMIFMYNRYENTLASQLLPLAVYASLFIFFAAIGFYPVWYIALNVIFVSTGLALLMSGGRGG